MPGLNTDLKFLFHRLQHIALVTESKLYKVCTSFQLLEIFLLKLKLKRTFSCLVHANKIAW